MRFSGAVLTGGRSSRMGSDKALLGVAGVPMALRVGNAMRDAGAEEVLAVGGNAEVLISLGFRFVPDVSPHEGPLSGIIAALRAASEPIVVVTACDMPWIESVHVAAVVRCLRNADVAVAAADGRWQPLHAAWSCDVLAFLEPAFRGGERSPMKVIRVIDHTVVELPRGLWSTDLDTPAELALSEEMNNRSAL